MTESVANPTEAAVKEGNYFIPATASENIRWFETFNDFAIAAFPNITKADHSGTKCKLETRVGTFTVSIESAHNDAAGYVPVISLSDQLKEVPAVTLMPQLIQAEHDAQEDGDRAMTTAVEKIDAWINEHAIDRAICLQAIVDQDEYKKIPKTAAWIEHCSEQTGHHYNVALNKLNDVYREYRYNEINELTAEQQNRADLEILSAVVHNQDWAKDICNQTVGNTTSAGPLYSPLSEAIDVYLEILEIRSAEMVDEKKHRAASNGALFLTDGNRNENPLDRCR